VRPWYRGHITEVGSAILDKVSYGIREYVADLLERRVGPIVNDITASSLVVNIKVAVA
jgi:hypothetical protein